MLLILAQLAFAAPVAVPVHGLLTDANGVGITGTRTVTFTLYGQGPSTFGPIWSRDLTIALSAGTFTAVLDGGSPTLVSELFRDYDDLALSIQPVGETASALVPLGRAPLAVHALHAADADALGGRAPDDYVRGDFTAGNGAGQVAVNNGTRNTDLNADLLDGVDSTGFVRGNFTAGNASGNVAVSNGTVNTHLNADLLDGRSAGNANGDVPVSNGTVNTNLNADLLDGLSASAFVQGAFSAGNANGNVPLSNGTVNTNLNADLLDGLSSGSFARLDQTNTFLGRVYADFPSWPQIEAKPAAGHAYLSASRATAAAGDAGVALRTGETANWYMYVPANSTDLRFTVPGADRVWMLANGNVGIGTSPSSRLHVAGEIRGETVRSNTEAFGAGSFTFPADGAWKDLIVDLNGHQLYEIVADYGTSCYHSVGYWVAGNTYYSTFINGNSTAHGGVPIQLQWVGSTYDVHLQVRTSAAVTPCGGGARPDVIVRWRTLSWD